MTDTTDRQDAMTDTTTEQAGTPAAPPTVGADATLDDATLFELDDLPPISLADKFGFPPMTALDRRQGPWQDRKRRWLSLGIESEVGRDDNLTFATSDTEVGRMIAAIGGTSVFDPVLAELAYRWWTSPGQQILDPFAGGSVRGIVASTLGRSYLGVDIRPEQVAANRAQAHLGGSPAPRWVTGDARHADDYVDGPADFVFTCPPYGDLERYSDDPDDLSTLEYAEFLEAYRACIATACDVLRPDRFAAMVVGDFRDKATGALRGFVGDTVRAFVDAGLAFWNEGIIIDPIGTARLRAERPFLASRKLTRTHQYLLVFVKGDAKRATLAAGGEGEP